MALPTYTGNFSAASGAGSYSHAWPTHSAGQLGILICEQSGADTTLDLSAQGWAHVSGSPVVDVADATGSKHSMLWKVAASGAESDVAMPDGGDHMASRMLVFDGVDSSTPIHVAATDTKTTASTSYAYPSLTTSVADCLILFSASRPNDSSSTTTFGTPSGGTLDSIGDLPAGTEQATTLSDGGGLNFSLGTKVTPGATGTPGGTISVSVTGTYIVVALQPPVTDSTPPTITGPGGATGSTSSVSIAENTTAVHTFNADESVTWDLNGGADVALFTINSGTGALAFSSAPDYESPADADTNNVYVVGVRATDAALNATTQTVSVTVTDVDESGNVPPVWDTAPSDMTTKRGQALTPQDLSALVSDADLDTLSFSATGLPTGVTVNSSSGIVSGTPTAAPGVYTVTPTIDDGVNSPVDGSTFDITVTQAVLALSGAGYEFADGSDLATAAVLAATSLNVAAYALSEWPPATPVASATDTTDTAGNLGDLGDDDLVYGTTYRVLARNPANGDTWAWTMAAS